MEGDAKSRPNQEEGKNPLLTALETIISGNREIGAQLEKFSRDQGQILSGISGERERLRMESSALEAHGRQLSSEIDRKSWENTARLQEILNAGLEKFQKVEIGFGEKDRILLDKVDNVFKKYWLVPVAISAVSLLFAFLIVFMALKFYRESVKSKGEVRSEILSGWNSQGKTLVGQDEWDALNNERVIVRSFVRDNKVGGKALVNYRKGMISANKGKPVYEDVESDKVVKE